MPFGFGKKNNNALSSNPEVRVGLAGSMMMIPTGAKFDPSIDYEQFMPPKSNKTGESSQPPAQREYDPSIAESTRTEAQSGYAPSIAESNWTMDSTASTIVNPARGQAASTPAEDEYAGEADEEPFVRPKTPPQGKRCMPWQSYSNLPKNHPVFTIPAEKREKMYSKGIDPVSKAEIDKRVFGKQYGQKLDKRQAVRGRLSEFTHSFGGINGMTTTF